ncbi:hypothetical protein CRG98_029342 [Punica granatum]|uniref:AAA+ ATPase domain-containing protein n=1 Tax=Punica granatum TaxID=22663 RepID=A0A2I0J1Z8_PUNGR|nr:hypothetical protein CRG98_029342 [Punica granatum]
MSELRVSDPSRLHLRRELTQIRKAARVLRDPGTTSSWKSPLSSSRSIAPPPPSSAASARRSSANDGGRAANGWGGNAEGERVESENRVGKDKEKPVFLYNWKARRFSDNAAANDEAEDGDQSSSSSDLAPGGSLGDSHSDAHNNSSASTLSRRRDANLTVLGTPSMKRTSGVRKRGKKLNPHLDALTNYAARKGEDMFLGHVRSSMTARARLNGNGHPSVTLSSVDQSDDDTEEYSNSEDIRRVSGASPLLLKFKHKNWTHSSSKFLRTSRRDDSSYTYSTPALSTSSFNRYRNRNPSTIGSWDGTATSVNDGDDEFDDPLDLPGGQGCGIPCYWSKRTPKHRGMCGSCCSPSLSDTLRRKGSSILCGSQSMYSVKRRSLSGSAKRSRIALKSSQGVLPLLTNSGDGRGMSSIGTGNSDDELSTNFGELDLEALSRLDGRRWSNCRSQDGSEILALNGDGEEDSMPENSRSLSQKYKPIFFNELIGQNIVVQSLANAVSRGRIAPVYLFQGPRGTGKTSTARIFAAALNCLSSEESKPCGYCKECTEFISGKSRDLCEVDGTNKKGIDKARCLLKNLSVRPPVPSAFSRYKVFIIDECHLLPSKTWLTFLKFVEDPPRRAVFIFITTDLDNVPRTVQSRCQKYLFSKIKDSDIVSRLRKISAEENLDVESDALDLIALNADGSLRDAETMLDQLSLLGKRITTSLVNELVGVVSDEKLLDLLELAMSSDTKETVRRARELMDSGVDPLHLMSQLASLIMDIIAGTYKMSASNYSEPLFGGRTLSEAELDRLKHALKLLSEADKQLRVSSEPSTWFAATLLQLGSVPSPEISQSSSSRRQSSRTTEEDPSGASREYIYRRKSDGPLKSASPAALLKEFNGDSHQGNVSSQIDDFISKLKASHEEYVNGCNSDASFDDIGRSNVFKFSNFEKLNNIWEQCIERCHSKTLRQLLHAHGKLVSIAEAEGILVAYIAFGDRDIKSRAERFLSSITNSIEKVVRRNVEVRIILLPSGESLLTNGSLLDSPELSKSETALATRKERRDAHHESLKVSRGSFNDVESKLKGGKLDDGRNSPLLDGTHQSNQGVSKPMAEETDETNQKREEIPMQRVESIIREQRLETAWLQATEKGTPGSLNRLRPVKNQVLPQEGSYDQHQMESVTSTALSSHNWEDELNHDLKVLKITDGKTLQKDNATKTHYPVSPSLLHDSNFAGTFNMESLVYESTSGNEGCGALFCWNKNRPHKREKAKRTAIRSRRHGRFSLFGRCVKPKSESRLRRRTVE